MSRRRDPVDPLPAWCAGAGDDSERGVRTHTVIPGRSEAEWKGILGRRGAGRLSGSLPGLRSAGNDKGLAPGAGANEHGWAERYAVSILASRRNGTLYIGVTSGLERRIAQHKARAVPGFTERCGVTILVYVERYASIYDAIAREKQHKAWNRAWKLIEAGGGGAVRPDEDRRRDAERGALARHGHAHAADRPAHLSLLGDGAGERSGVERAYPRGILRRHHELQEHARAQHRNTATMSSSP